MFLMFCFGIKFNEREGQDPPVAMDLRVFHGGSKPPPYGA